MVANRAEAKDAIYGVLFDAWSNAVISQDIELLYREFNEDESPISPEGSTAEIESWAVAEILHQSGRAVSFGPNRLYKYTAELNVYIHTPAGDGAVLADALAILVEEAFKVAKFSNLWFRDVVSFELGRSGAWFVTRTRINVEYNTRVM